MKVDIITAQKGDIVHFAKYSLRIEAEPIRKPGSITLFGRISIDGCPTVTKHFMAGRIVEIERAGADASEERANVPTMKEHGTILCNHYQGRKAGK